MAEEPASSPAPPSLPISLFLGLVLGLAGVGCEPRKSCDPKRLEAGVPRVEAAEFVDQPAIAARVIVDACGRPPTQLLNDHLAWKADPLATTLSRAEFDDPLHDALWKEVCPNGPDYLDMFVPGSSPRNAEMYRVCEHAKLGILSADEEAIAFAGPSSFLVFAWIRREGAPLASARALTRALLLPGVLPRALDLPEGQSVPKLASGLENPGGTELRIDGASIFVDFMAFDARPGDGWSTRWHRAFADATTQSEDPTTAYEGQTFHLIADASLPAEALVELLRFADARGAGPVYVAVETPEPYRPLAAVPLRRARAEDAGIALGWSPDETLGAVSARAAEAMGQPCCIEEVGPGCPAKCRMPAAPLAIADIAEPDAEGLHVLGVMGEMSGHFLDSPNTGNPGVHAD